MKKPKGRHRKVSATQLGIASISIQPTTEFLIATKTPARTQAKAWKKVGERLDEAIRRVDAPAGR
jgi:hypothetical protein